MSLADISIKRPIFITSVVLLSVATGLLAMTKIGVDQFPDITLPAVTVTTAYPGAGPSEIETLVTKPIEDELSTISGIKRLSSENREGYSIVIAEFNLEVDVKYAEQQVRDHTGTARVLLPTDVKESTIQRLDPADQPIISMSLKADLPPAKLYDLANERLKPMIEQVNNVGKVDILGGRKREIHVNLNREKLKKYELSATQISGRLNGTGQNVPGGKKDLGNKQITFRTLGEFNNLPDLGRMVVNFFSNEVPVRIEDVGTVTDTLEDETTRTFVNGSPTLTINAYKQSGSNTVKVSDELKKKIIFINKQLESEPGHPQIALVRDGSKVVRLNVEDVEESILIGVVLAVVVVFLFLANFRSTIITGLALPNSLIGAFVLMWAAGYTLNIMTLLALTLSVGLLVDDAIVVRENIFRHIEMGKGAIRAALDGTKEVQLAVIATTLTVVAVFGPLAFLSGVVGQFFKQFGLTVVFAMFISLFDALTIAPMLSAYFAGRHHAGPGPAWYRYSVGGLLTAFSNFQDWLEVMYERLLRVVTRHPLITIGLSLVIFVACMSLNKYIPKTFLPDNDAGEFLVNLDLPPGTTLDGMGELALQVDKVLRQNPEIAVSSLTVGSTTGDANQASFYLLLTESKTRKLSTTQVKAKVREELKPFANANPIVADVGIAGNQRAFNVNILGTDQAVLEKIGQEVKDRLKQNPALLDVDVNFRPGKPEFQVHPSKDKLERFGVSAAGIGGEIKAQIEGLTPAKFRENGLEYDIRVRLQEDQRDLEKGFSQTYIPNINDRLIRLESISLPVVTTGPAVITRQDRMKYVQINADIRPGKGLGEAMTDTTALLTKDIKLPPGYSFKFVGQGEDFQELGTSVLVAMSAAILFILLVLASLYESFVTPLTIMLAMPLAICGAFAALAFTGESLNLLSMIGLVMLLGVAVKNSILLVDYAHQQIAKGVDRTEAIIMAGRTRLRPILMTSMALVAGTLPIAMGLNEASKQRVSMGVAIIGGLVSSTLLTLVVIPAAFSYIDRFRVWMKNFLGGLFIEDFERTESSAASPQSKIEAVMDSHSGPREL